MPLKDFDRMPTQDRLQAMELLWQSFRQDPHTEDVVSAWHQQVLRERLIRLQEGVEKTTAWPQAKEKLRALTKQATPK